MDSPIQRFQFLNKYAREGERTWKDATRRVEKYMRRQCPAIDEGTWAFVNKHVANRGATWAMRVLQMAGPATEKCQVGLYNCAYVPVESLRDFTDALYILMQGTGVGFSVENVDALPAVLPPGDSARLTWTVEDSTEGWVAALRAGLSAWWNGMDLAFDYSAIRPAGAPLRTKGGRASGPEPLRELLDFARDVVRGAAGRKITSLEVHRIFCKIGRIVEVGGVRRAAMLSLSRLDDDEMRHAKDGSFWEEFPELTMANNSAVYEERPSRNVWEREWAALRASGTGERGVFNRASRRKRERKGEGKVGTNPCVAGDTWIATAEGPRQVRDLLEGPFTAIVGGKPYHATPFWKTGEKEIFRVSTREGYTLRATIDHRVYTTKGKVPVGSLDPGDQIIVDSDEHATVVSVVPDGIEEVYDCTVEEVHRYSANGLLVSNCGEIVLFPRQFCNLTIAVVRPGDTFADLAEKVRAAAIMGTIQSACTRFSPVIDRRWKEQTERERLLGVDLLGATDAAISSAEMAALRKIVVDTNREYAAILGIPPATAATCIKPGGNSSVLLGTGNSVTGWFAEYYLRRVRVNKVDPMFAFLAESGVPWAEEYHDPRIAVFAFPCRAEGPVLRDGAIARLEWWRELQVHWAEHSVSATIYVRDGEWDAVRDWVWEHWDDVTGLTFLPADDSVYPLAPLEEITAEEYAAAIERFPNVDWEAFSPSGDGTRELVCTAGACTWG